MVIFRPFRRWNSRPQSRGYCWGTLVCLAIVLGLQCAPVYAEDSPTTALRFLDETPLAIELGTDMPTPVVFVVNPTPDPLQLSFFALVQEGKGKRYKLAATICPQEETASAGSETEQTTASADLCSEKQGAIAASSVQSFMLHVVVPEGVAQTNIAGYLVAAPTKLPAGKMVQPATLALTMAPKPPPLFKNVLGVPLLYALITVALAALSVMGGFYSITPGWTSRMLGAPKWEFTTNWTSVTTLGTAFGSALFAGFVPDQFSKGVASLAALFAALVVIAPLVYNIWLSPAPHEAQQEADDEIRYQGSTICYFLATLLTLWGVFGSLYIAQLLLNAVPWPVLTDELTSGFLRTLPQLVAGLIALYAITTIYRTVKEQTVLNPDPAAVARAMEQMIEQLPPEAQAEMDAELFTDIQPRVTMFRLEPAQPGSPKAKPRTSFPVM